MLEVIQEYGESPTVSWGKYLPRISTGSGRDNTKSNTATQLASNRDIVAYSINLAILSTLYTASLALNWRFRVLIPQAHSWGTEAGGANYAQARIIRVTG